MAIAHDTGTRFPASTVVTDLDTTTGDRTFSHAAAAGADGAVVIVLSDIGSATVTGVLYGGTAMAPVAAATDTSEPGHVQIFLLNSLGSLGLGGTQTVTLQGCTATGKVAYCHTCTSATGYTALDGLVEKNTTTATNPTADLTTVANAMVYGGLMGGAGAPTSYAYGTGEEAFSGGTGAGTGGDFGANAGLTARSTSVTGAGTYTINWTYATSDDYCIAAISVKEAPAPTSTSVAQVSLGLGYEPLSRTAHSLKFRGRKQSGTGTVKFRAALYEGASNRSGDLESTTALTTSVAEYALAIADASAANITSYSDLELRFWAYSSTGDTVTVEVEEAWLETPGSLIVTGQAAIAATAAMDAAGTRISGAVTGQASLDATATVAAVPQRVVQRQVDIGATAVVDATPHRVVQRQAVVSATADVVAAGIRAGMVTAQASIDATAEVVAVPQRVVRRQVAIDATAAVAADGGKLVAVATGQAQIAATADVLAGAGGQLAMALGAVVYTSVTSLVIPAGAVSRAASIDATAAVQAAGARVPQIVTGQASLDAVAVVAAVPQRTVQRQASIDATAAVAAVPQRVVQRQVAIGAAVDVVAAGARAEALVTGQAALDATADIGAAGARVPVTVAGSASVDAVAAVEAVGIRLVMGQAALAATADVVAVPQRELSRAVDVSAAAGVVAAGHGVQLLRPSADSVDGDWTNEVGGTLLAPSVAEPEPNDSDYIHSGPSVPSSCRLKLGSAAAPTVGSRVLRFRAGGESGPVDVTVRLRQGGGDVLGAGTLVNEFAHPDLGALDLVEDEVTGDISDYSDLYVELVAG